MGTNHEDTHINESILSEAILEDQKKNRIDHMTYLPGMEDIGSEILDQVVAAMEAYDYNTYTAEDVKRALAHAERTPEDFQALLSPAALPFLEEIAQAAQIETRKHFGNSVYMFTPIYIANYCENYCIYCGFNCHNKINRAQLNAEEIEKEMAAIAKTGLQEILILTGALASVDQSYYNAARVDGTSRFRIFMRITLPMISPMIFYLVITGFIGAFKSYSDAVALFGTNLNAAGMNTIVGYVYDMLYGEGGGYPSYASAAAILLFIIVLTITCINLLVSRRKVFYGKANN